MLCIMLLTYNRLEYARVTLESTLKNLKTNEKVHVHIASDGDTPEYVGELINLAGEFSVPITTSKVNRLGYGANYNAATQIIHNLPDCEYVLPLEDDWELVKPFDVDPILQVLSDRVFGCVRMGYIGYTQQLDCSFVSHNNLHYLLLNKDSAEPHVFAGHPRLETVAWQRTVGPWEEGLLPGQTEWEVAKRKEARSGIAWPISLIKPEGDLFAHIGAVRSY